MGISILGNNSAASPLDLTYQIVHRQLKLTAKIRVRRTEASQHGDQRIQLEYLRHYASVQIRN